MLKSMRTLLGLPRQTLLKLFVSPHRQPNLQRHQSTNSSSSNSAGSPSSGSKHGGVLRFKIEQSPQFSGVRSTRGNREFNEDRFQRATIRLNGVDAVYCAVFDGHGGSHAADYCAGYLHREIERVFNEEAVTELPSADQSASLQETDPADNVTSLELHKLQSRIEAAVRLAFHNTDQSFISTHNAANSSTLSNGVEGTTASIAILYPIIKSTMSGPKSVSISATEVPLALLTIGHLGDTRALMADTMTGKAQQLSVDHIPLHKDERLRVEKAGGFITTDSFGQLAVMGVLAMSRSIGVAKLKRMGSMISSEPQVLSRIIDTKDSFLVLASDGLTSVMSNQEIIDSIKQFQDPSAAAASLVDSAERYGTADNCTALVIRLPGWPLHRTPPATKDYTKNLRRYKVRHSLLGSRPDRDSSSSMYLSSNDVDNDDDNEDDDDNSNQTDTPNNSDKTLVRNRRDIFIIDLFDVIGQDMGSDSTFFPGRDQAPMIPIGRIHEQEVQDGMLDLDVVMKKVEPGSEEMGPAQVACAIFEVYTGTEDGMTAADILESLRKLDVFPFYRVDREK